jgi:hypothetical protein
VLSHGGKPKSAPPLLSPDEFLPNVRNPYRLQRCLTG